MRWQAHMVAGAGFAKAAILAGSHLPLAQGVTPKPGWQEVPVIAGAALAALLADTDSPFSLLGSKLAGDRLYGAKGQVGHEVLGVTMWHRWRWHSIGAATIAAVLAGLLFARVPIGPVIWVLLVALYWKRSKGWAIVTALVTAPPLFSTILVSDWMLSHLGPLWIVWAASGVLIGYLSHLVVDDPYGRQMLGWPFSKKLIRSGLVKVKTDSLAGNALEIAVGAATVILLMPPRVWPVL